MSTRLRFVLVGKTNKNRVVSYDFENAEAARQWMGLCDDPTIKWIRLDRQETTTIQEFN